ncbi:MAG: hypothetical protein R2867_46820 [Caldilineaceae bacterium]
MRVPYGLTGGIHSLDDEITYWKERVQSEARISTATSPAPLYSSSLVAGKRRWSGQGQQAVPTMCRSWCCWEQAGLPTQSDPNLGACPLLDRCGAMVGNAAGKNASKPRPAVICGHGKVITSSQEHDPSHVLGESNVLRYRPCRGLLFRITEEAKPIAVAQVLLAVRVTGQPLTLSLSPTALDTWAWLADENNTFVVEEDDAGLAARLITTHAYDRLRTTTSLPTDLLEAAHASGVAVIDAAVMANGRLELRWYLREQVVSQTMHRYGNLLQ